MTNIPHKPIGEPKFYNTDLVWKRFCDYCSEPNPSYTIELSRTPNGEKVYAELCDVCLADITRAQPQPLNDGEQSWLDNWKPIFVNGVIPKEFRLAIAAHSPSTSPEHLKSHLEANLLDGDQVQDGQMIASWAVLEWALDYFAGHSPSTEAAVLDARIDTLKCLVAFEASEGAVNVHDIEAKIQEFQSQRAALESVTTDEGDGI